MFHARDPASNQLENWYATSKDKNLQTSTTSYGTPLADKDNIITVGARGPQLLEDVAFLDEMAHFDRERIPERVVHAHGAAAFGQFTVTHDITKYTAAKLFAEVGKTTPIAVRFSLVSGEKGSADTRRDPRGFAIKFYTEDGNWDLVGNNTPVFFVRDPIRFPNFIHTQKRNPVTNLHDVDMYFDFFSLMPESIHQYLILFTDRGTPDGFRHMHGFGSNTFKLINNDGEAVYCKFHYLTEQGIRNLTAAKARELQAFDPDYSVRDLYNAISSRNYPSWNFYIQVMTYAEAHTLQYNPFDVTKIWPHKQFPLLPVGTFTLTKNCTNYFSEVEQLAFSPARMVPGIGPSPDKMLQGRLFAYDDTQRHRLGANFMQLPVNCPFRMHNFQRDGPGTLNNQGGGPNYHPNSYGGPESSVQALKLVAPYQVDDDIVHYYDNKNEDNFSQPRIFYETILNEFEKQTLISNLADLLSQANEKIQLRLVMLLNNVSADLANKLQDALNERKGQPPLQRL